LWVHTYGTSNGESTGISLHNWHFLGVSRRSPASPAARVLPAAK
jgi:hypothetical protein